MKEQRIRDLIAYVKLLTGLMETGFKCEQEMKQAVAELHILMLNKEDENSEKVFILVLEEDFEGVVKSTETFEKIIGKNAELARTGDDTTLVNGNKSVKIMKISHFSKYKTQGLRPDYIINNTEYESIELGIKTK